MITKTPIRDRRSVRFWFRPDTTRQGALYPRPRHVEGHELASVPPSAWYAGQAEQYGEALVREAYDVLVVPFQVQGFGIDAALDDELLDE